MKKLMFTMAMAAFAMVSCGSSKAVATPTPAPDVTQTPQKPTRADSLRAAIEEAELEARLAQVRAASDATIAKAEADAEMARIAAEQAKAQARFEAIPCVETMHDTDEYFAALGMSTEKVEVEAKAQQEALNTAKMIVKSKIGGAVKGLATEYANDYRGSTLTASTQSKIESAFETVIDRILNDTKSTCAQREVIRGANDGRGISKTYYKYYMTVRVEKQNFIDEFSTELSKDEKLEIDFRSANFMEYMDKKLKEYKETQNPATTTPAQ